MRSVLAVVAGIAAISVLALGTDAIVHQALGGYFDEKGLTDHPGVLLFMLAYSLLFSAIGGWVTAAVSRRASRDVKVLAAIQLVMSLLAASVLWVPSLLWFYAATIVLGPVAIMLGGRLRTG